MIPDPPNTSLNVSRQSPAGTKWAVGTEIHLVNRLMKENPDRFIIPLDDCGCLCSTMFRIDPQHLLWSLENLLEGRVVNQITVPCGYRRRCPYRSQSDVRDHRIITIQSTAPCERSTI